MFTGMEAETRWHALGRMGQMGRPCPNRTRKETAPRRSAAGPSPVLPLDPTPVRRPDQPLAPTCVATRSPERLRSAGGVDVGVGATLPAGTALMAPSSRNAYFPARTSWASL